MKNFLIVYLIIQFQGFNLFAQNHHYYVQYEVGVDNPINRTFFNRPAGQTFLELVFQGIRNGEFPVFKEKNGGFEEMDMDQIKDRLFFHFPLYDKPDLYADNYYRETFEEKLASWEKEKMKIPDTKIGDFVPFEMYHANDLQFSLIDAVSVTNDNKLVSDTKWLSIDVLNWHPENIFGYSWPVALIRTEDLYPYLQRNNHLKWYNMLNNADSCSFDKALKEKRFKITAVSIFNNSFTNGSWEMTISSHHRSGQTLELSLEQKGKKVARDIISYRDSITKFQQLICKEYGDLDIVNTLPDIMKKNAASKPEYFYIITYKHLLIDSIPDAKIKKRVASKTVYYLNGIIKSMYQEEDVNAIENLNKLLKSRYIKLDTTQSFENQVEDLISLMTKVQLRKYGAVEKGVYSSLGWDSDVTFGNENLFIPIPLILKVNSNNFVKFLKKHEPYMVDQRSVSKSGNRINFDF